MRARQLAVTAALLGIATAQVNLSSLISEGASFLNSVTSVLGQTPSTTATLSSSSTTSTSSSTTSSSSFTTSTSTPASRSSPTSSSTTPTSTSAVQSAVPNANDNHGSNTLAIVLGVTLGLLALAAFLLLLFLCCRRRRKRQERLAAKDRPYTPSDDGLDSYSENKRAQSLKGPRTISTPVSGTTAVAPTLTEREKEPYLETEHNNAYVPVLSSNRASLSRNDLSAIHRYDDQRYPTEPMQSQHHSRHPIAIAAGGAAVGGLAAHEIEKRHRDHPEDKDSAGSRFATGPGVTAHDHTPYAPDAPVDGGRRRSGSVGGVASRESWPNNAEGRRSGDLRRSLSRPQSGPLPDGYPHVARDVAIAGAVGAVSRKPISKSPHRRKGILKQTTSDSSDPYSLSSDSSRGPFADRYAARQPIGHHSGPHELGVADDEISAHNHHHRGQEDALGSLDTAVIGQDERRRRYSRDGRSNRDVPGTPLAPPAPLHTRRAATPPTVPSRSPRRSSFHNNARYSPTTLGTAEVHGNSLESGREAMSISPAPEVHHDHSGNSNDDLVSPVSAPSRQGTFSGPHNVSREGIMPDHRPANYSAQGLAINNRNSTSEYSTDNNSGLLHKSFGTRQDVYSDQIPHPLASNPSFTESRYPNGSEVAHLSQPSRARPQVGAGSMTSSRQNTNFGGMIPQPRPSTNERHLQLMGKNGAMQDYRGQRNYDPRLTRNSSYGTSGVGVAR